MQDYRKFRRFAGAFLGNSQDSGLAKLLESILDQVLKAQVKEQVSAEPYERTEERQGHRNGSYPRQLTTRVGSITLHVPRIRDGNFSTEMFLRYQRSEQALLLALMEIAGNGVSTRKVSQITEELCGTKFSKSTVSELCKNLDPIIEAWLNRPLSDDQYPFLLVDAMYLKVREDGRVRSRGVMIAVGINADGYREVLGMMVGDTESESSCSEFLSRLKDRGFVRAIRQYFYGVTWQGCQTHFMKNILDATPNSLKDEVHSHVQAILEAPDEETARMLLCKTTSFYEDKAPKAMSILQSGFDDASAVLVLPEKYRKTLRTTNSIERLNEEIRRRERVYVFSQTDNPSSAWLGALLMEQDEKWTTRKKYFDMEEYFTWRESQIPGQTHKVTRIF